MPPAYQGDPTRPNYYIGFDAAPLALGKAIGVVPDYPTADSPGGSVDNTQSDAMRQQTQDLIASLQQQAASGDGAWQQSFAQAVQHAKANASGLGQSEAAQAKSGAAGALRNIGNAQSAIGQRAVGDELNLRTEAEKSAQNQLGQLEAAQGQGDIAQSATNAAVNQARLQADQALGEQAQQNASNLSAGLQKAGTSFMSHGGKVPGKPEVFGDNERNDTVPALLSPGEIVVPRTKAKDPRAAAKFAKAVAERHGRRMADGGDVQPFTADEAGDTALLNLIPGFGSVLQQQAYQNKIAQAADHPTVGNGGLLDTSQFAQTRGQMDTLGGQLKDRAAGGTSIADNIAQQQSDESAANAIAAQNAHHAVMANILQAQAAQGSRVASGAGAKRGAEQADAQNALGNLTTTRRAQEQALADAQQKAAWTNTMIKAGINLSNQTAVRNALAGAGQGAVGLSQILKRNDTGVHPEGGGGDEYGDPSSGQTNDLGDQGTADLSGGGDEYGDPSSGQTNDIGSQDGMAEGGEVKPRVVVDSGIANYTLARLKREYDAQKAQEAIAKGPDLSYNLLRFAQALKDKAARQEVPAALASTPYKSALAAVAPGVQQPVMVPMPAPMPAPKQLQAVPVQRVRSPVAQPLPDEDLGDLSIQHAHGGSIQKLSGGGDAGASDAGTPPIPGLDLGAFDHSSQAPQAVSAPDAGLDPNSLYAPGTAGKEISFPGAELDKNSVYQISPKDRSEGMARYVPPAQPAPKLPAVKPPAAAVAPPKTRGASSPIASIVQPDGKAERSALEQSTKTEQQKADEIYKAQAAALTAQQQLQNDQRDLQRQAQTDAHAQMAKFDAANDALQRIDTTVDPNHYWASQSTPQKIMGAIGLILGSFGKDGINQSALMIGKAIDRDIDSQKMQVQLALKKGEANVANVQNMVQMHRDTFKDDQAALTAAQVSALGLAAQQVRLTEAKFAGTEAGDRLKMLSAQLDQTIADKKRAIVKDSLDDAYKRAQTAAAYAQATKDSAEAQKALNPVTAQKNAAQVAGTLAAVDDLEKEMKDATSTQIGSKRASLEAELLKLQGGRYNKEIHQLMEEIVPGNEGYSVAGRASSKIFPESMKQRFETLRKHIRTEGNSPQEDDPEAVYQ